MISKKYNRVRLALVYIYSLVYAFAISKGIDNIRSSDENLFVEDEIVIEDLTKEKISDLINGNPNLSLDEKIFLYDTYIVLVENSEYIVYEQVVNFLQNIDFNYGTLSGSTAGRYSVSNDLIELRDDHFSDESYSTLLHEIFHGYSYTPSDITKVSYYLNEIFNEICKVEYAPELGIVSTPTSYDKDLIIGHVLSEILDDDVINQFKFNCDFDILKNELLKLGVDASDIEEFYNILDSIHYITIIIRDHSLLDDVYVNMFNVLDKFYFAKYNESMLDNFEILFLLKNTVLEIDVVSEKLNLYIENSVYFSGEYAFEYDNVKFNEDEYSVSYREIFNNTDGNDEHKYIYFGNNKIINDSLSPDQDFLIFLDEFNCIVSDNVNLTNDEKYVISITIPFLNNYFMYLNTDQILEIFKNLKIEYKGYGDASLYDKDSNTLFITTTDFTDNRKLLFGEFIQLFTYSSGVYNDYINDVASEMFNYEYYPYHNDVLENDSIFEKDMHIVYFLYELLGSEFLYSYQFNPSNVDLKNHLYELGFDVDQASELLLLLDELNIIKHHENNDEEMSKFIFKFYKFLIKHSTGNSYYSNMFEKAAFLAYRRIEINYYIDEDLKSAVVNDKLYFLDEINVFNKYSFGNNLLFNNKVK